MNLKYISDREKFSEFRIAKNGVPYIAFKPFEKYDFINAGFSTRLGGVSTGGQESMNLSTTVGDDAANVRKNFEIMAETLGVDAGSFVYAHQTHTTNVIRVRREHAGMGIYHDRNFHDVDGLVTNEKNLCLVTGHADCVPLYFVDPVKQAIGLAHSGWKGTCGNIAQNVVDMMKSEFGSDSMDIIGLIGPSICADCYEIGDDVADIFREKYEAKGLNGVVMPHKEKSGKYLLDLHLANRYNMLGAGLDEANIYVSDICTKENPDILFSHRAHGMNRGGMCAFLMIRG